MIDFFFNFQIFEKIEKIENSKIWKLEYICVDPNKATSAISPDVSKIEIFKQKWMFFRPEKWIFFVFKLFGAQKPSLQFISDIFRYILGF